MTETLEIHKDVQAEMQTLTNVGYRFEDTTTKYNKRGDSQHWLIYRTSQKPLACLIYHETNNPYFNDYMRLWHIYYNISFERKEDGGVDFFINQGQLKEALELRKLLKEVKIPYEEEKHTSTVVDCVKSISNIKIDPELEALVREATQ